MSSQKGFYTFTLTEDSDPLRMRFDFNAIADIEDMLGSGVGKLFSEDRMGFSTIRAMYWAGLKWKLRGLTIEKTGKMLQKYLDEGGELEDLAKHLTEALYVSGILTRDKASNDDDEDDDFESEEDDQEKN